MRRRLILVVPVVVALLTVAYSNRDSDTSSPGSSDTPAGGVGTTGGGSGEPVRFEEASLIVETNATDGDAGLQVFLDHEPWKSISISLPDGTKMLDIETEDVLVDYGLTELFSESSEPPFTKFPFEEFVKLFPEGRYTFAGETIDGKKLRSSVRLTHDIPAGPDIVAPEENSTVAPSDVVVRWEQVTEPSGIEIVAYQVIVERDDPLRVLDVKVPATATELRVPAEFMEPGVEYKVEVLAIDKRGNQTLTEVPFITA
jgi:Fibronectin type III domain